MNSFLERLRELSVERCEKHFFSLNDWSVLEWAGAAAGECGEAANVAKKIKRQDKNQDKLQIQLGEEVADTIIYLDLLCASRNIDLESVIKRKFNQDSVKIGYSKNLS